tara:strand:+ start:208 stop:1569 length:1362 start_codon:yes stop_codon:yes gene_type:complete
MASTQISRSISSSGSTTKATLSCWFKRVEINTEQFLFYNIENSNNNCRVRISSDNKLEVEGLQGGSAAYTLRTVRTFEDPSAWFHLVVGYDSTDSTANDRIKIYVNGTEMKDLENRNNPSSSGNMSFNEAGTVYIGGQAGSNYFNGCLAHYHWVDGTRYAASTFGETDSTSGIWKPITNPSVTYGTNGFFLKFDDSTNLDLDSSGNSQSFTTAGTLTQTIDTPSNVLATLNPLYTIEYRSELDMSNGNTTANHHQGAWNTVPATFAVSSGKWYFEGYGHTNSSNYIHYGITSSAKMNANKTQPESEIQANSNGYAEGYYGNNGNRYYSTTSASTSASYGASYGSTDYIGIFIDLDNNKLYFAKNGTLQNSGTGLDINTAGKPYLPCISLYDGSTNVNFGSGVFGTTALTGTTYSDANGTGTFKYSPNQGGASNFDSAAKNFYTLNTKNIKEFG